MIALSQIYEALSRVYEAAVKTPLSYSAPLSAPGQQVWLKCENLQTIGAYKIRGAYNRIALLSPEARARGVIAASAGNHAQGVAYSARLFGAPAFIVMPSSTPLMKVANTQALGASVILHGDNFDEAYAHARELEAERGLAFIHPFADEAVMAGQGTIFLEILKDLDSIDAIVAPIGGGGLICGIASAAKQIKPDIKVIGVQARGASAFASSFAAGKIANARAVKTIADGIAVRDVDELCFDIARECVDEIITVDDEEIAAAVLFLLERHKLIAEGAGAAATAALLHGKIRAQGKIAAIISGGNIDVSMLATIIEKGLFKSARKMCIRVTLIDKPGALEQLCEVLKRAGANIVKIDYDRFAASLDYGDANITITLEIKGEQHQEQIALALHENEFKFTEIRG